MQRLRLARRWKARCGALALYAASFASGGCMKAGAPPGVPTVVVPVTGVGEAAPIAGVASADAPHAPEELDGPEPGDRVEVEWKGSWFPATILERRGDRWLIHYDRFGDEWDETVDRERIRARVKAVEDETTEDDGDP